VSVSHETSMAGTESVTVIGDDISGAGVFSCRILSGFFLCHNLAILSSTLLCSFVVWEGFSHTSVSVGTTSDKTESLFCSFIPCIGIKNKYNA